MTDERLIPVLLDEIDRLKGRLKNSVQAHLTCKGRRDAQARQLKVFQDRIRELKKELATTPPKKGD